MPRLPVSGPVRLLFLSTLASLLACTLLRVLSCEIRFLAYFQSYIYACVLAGLAIGCLDYRFKRLNLPASSWFVYFGTVLALAAGVHFSWLRDLNALKDGSTYFICARFLDNYLLNELLIGALVFVSFTLVIRCFIPLGSAVAGAFAGMNGARGLAVFFAGAALGWGLYFFVVWLAGQPAALVALLGTAFLALCGGGALNIAVVAACLGLALSYNMLVEPPSVMELRTSYPACFQDFWTPDGHVQTYPFATNGKLLGFGVSTNYCLSGVVLDRQLSEAESASLNTAHHSLKGYSSRYFKAPLVVCKNPARVLVVGGGTGNEAAQALSMGAGHVDVVDSRAWMFRLGEMSPSRPFASPAVSQVVTDPRQFLKESANKYDLILFAPLESECAFSPFGLLRPDNFAYSTESFLDARDHLNPGGYLAVSYKPFRQWYARRLAHNLLLGYGTIDALVKSPFRSYMFASREQNRLLSTLLLESFKPGELENVEKLMADAEDVPATIDDWPFLYLASPGLPRSYLFMIVLMTAAMLLQLRPLLRNDRSAGARDKDKEGNRLFAWYNWRVAILAAAFMVAAGKTVMTLAFNFGATWHTAAAGAVAIFLCACLPAALAAAGMNLPVWLTWLMVFLAYGADYNFNYEAVVSIGNPLLRLLASGLLPVLPPLFVAVALVRNIPTAGNPDVTLGMLLMGFVAAKFLEHGCLVSSISSLDIGGIMLCVLAIAVRRRKETVP
jgi:spermidine synthase